MSSPIQRNVNRKGCECVEQQIRGFLKHSVPAMRITGWDLTSPSRFLHPVLLLTAAKSLRNIFKMGQSSEGATGQVMVATLHPIVGIIVCQSEKLVDINWTSP